MIDVLEQMVLYSIDFLVGLGAWLISSPVAFIICVLGLLTIICELVKRMVSA